ncbi:SDR family NAD(P)-dependent oxidoreductase [Ochrobactrum sp. Kaboul]|nr:SDR family NAD(P)-dependent oxidoreductase [Ochrobactrum sp. Kaboul]
MNTATSSPISRCLITGASSGLGAALARHLARPGASLVLIARDDLRLEAVAHDCRLAGAQVETIALDVQQSEKLATRIAAVDAVHPINAVYVNAGVEASNRPDRADEELSDIIKQIRTNLEGAIATVQPLIEPMRIRGKGRIVLISSLAGLMPLCDQPTYGATKAALIAYGEALRPLLSPQRVTLTVACPGFMATGMTEMYHGWRPLEWSAEKSAAHIVAAAERGARRVAFPWPLFMLIRLGHMVPAFLRESILQRLFSVEIASVARRKGDLPSNGSVSLKGEDADHSHKLIKPLP